VPPAQTVPAAPAATGDDKPEQRPPRDRPRKRGGRKKTPVAEAAAPPATPPQATPAQEPAATSPAGQTPSPPSAGSATTPPAPKEEPAAAPPEPALSPEEQQAALAGIDKIYFNLLSKSAAPVNLMIQQKALQMADVLNLTIGDPTATPPPAVMLLALNAVPAGQGVAVVMMGSVIIITPEGKKAKVWEGQQLVAQVPKAALKRSDFTTLIRPGITAFFDQFTRDFRQARAKAEGKDPNAPQG
jgi:hypothetical protein